MQYTFNTNPNTQIAQQQFIRNKNQNNSDVYYYFDNPKINDNCNFFKQPEIKATIPVTQQTSQNNAESGRSPAEQINYNMLKSSLTQHFHNGESIVELRENDLIFEKAIVNFFNFNSNTQHLLPALAADTEMLKALDPALTLNDF